MPVQFDQLLTSLQSDTREDLKTLLDEYGNALDKGGAEAFNRSIPYWKSAYRDTAIVNEASLGRDRARPLGLRQERGRDGRGAGPQPRAAQEPDHRLQHDGRARSPASRTTCAPRSPSCRARCAPPSPRSPSLNASFPPLRAFTADLRPGVQSSEAALDASIPLVRQLRGLVSEDELRGLAADLRPTIPALARLARESIPLAEQNRLLASCQNEVVLPWAKDKVEDKQFPAQGPVYTEAPKAFPGLAGESRSGDANGQWFRVLAAGGTNLVQLAPGRVRHDDEPDPRRQPAEAEGAPAAGRDAAVREPGDAGPAQPAGRPAARSGRPTRAPQAFKDRYALAQAAAPSTGSRASSSARASTTSSRSPTRTPRRA